MRLYEFCLRCHLGLAWVESKEAGFCRSCRDNLVPSHIPEEQHKRYLKRIGAYETYKED